MAHKHAGISTCPLPSCRITFGPLDRACAVVAVRADLRFPLFEARSTPARIANRKRASGSQKCETAADLGTAPDGAYELSANGGMRNECTDCFHRKRKVF